MRRRDLLRPGAAAHRDAVVHDGSMFGFSRVAGRARRGRARPDTHDLVPVPRLQTKLRLWPSAKPATAGSMNLIECSFPRKWFRYVPGIYPPHTYRTRQRALRRCCLLPRLATLGCARAILYRSRWSLCVSREPTAAGTYRRHACRGQTSAPASCSPLSNASSAGDHNSRTESPRTSG